MTMRLGPDTGSLTNHLMSRMVVGAPEPAVGMGATMLAWTDRHAGTIIEVSKDGRRVIVQADSAKRTDDRGMSEMQEWAHAPDPEGAIYTYVKGRNGMWREASGGSRGLMIGRRDHYHDFSF